MRKKAPGGTGIRRELAKNHSKPKRLLVALSHFLLGTHQAFAPEACMGFAAGALCCMSFAEGSLLQGFFAPGACMGFAAVFFFPSGACIDFGAEFFAAWALLQGLFAAGDFMQL